MTLEYYSYPSYVYSKINLSINLLIEDKLCRAKLYIILDKNEYLKGNCIKLIKKCSFGYIVLHFSSISSK